MATKHFFRILLLIGLCLISGCLNLDKSRTHRVNTKTEIEDPIDPDRPPTERTLYIMADILATQGRDQEAEALYGRILSEYPTFMLAYNDYAELLMRQRRIPAAMKVLESGLQVNPNDPVLINNMGMCWLIRTDYEKALQYFTTAAGLVPENTRYRSNMATALALMGRRNEALSLYKQVLTEEEAAENIQILFDSLEKIE